MRIQSKYIVILSFVICLNILPSENRDLSKQPYQFTDLLNRTMNQRPEIKAVKKRLEMAQKKLNAAKGTHLPKVDAYVSYGANSKNLDFNSNQDNVTAGVVTVTRHIETEVARDKAHSHRIAAQFDTLRAKAQLNQAIGFWK